MSVARISIRGGGKLKQDYKNANNSYVKKKIVLIHLEKQVRASAPLPCCRYAYV